MGRGLGPGSGVVGWCYVCVSLDSLCRWQVQVSVYCDRLVYLKLHFLQRRRERYCIIYVWKIIEGLVPNFSNPIVCSYSDRRGRSCIVSHVHVGRLGTLAFNSFRWRVIRLFNAMPNHIRCISSCSVLSFKCKFELYLRNIVDLPGRPGFNNSLDSMNYKQWWTPREDLAAKQPEVTSVDATEGA